MSGKYLSVGRISPEFSDKRTWTQTLNSDQTPQNAAPDQDLRC